MKHSAFILLFVMAICSSAALAQDCKVPTSFLLRADYMQAHDGLGGNRGFNDIQLSQQKLDNFTDSCGFSTDMKNTRYAICINKITTTRSATMRVSLTDTDHDIVLYSMKLDTCYIDEDVKYLTYRMYQDLHMGKIPQYLQILDTIRTEIISLYETNTPSFIKTIKQLIADNDMEHAMFKLAQYPACCPSYRRVQPLIVVTFREYVRKNHSALLRQAKQAWANQENETDARFVISLLNSEELSKSERKKADDILKKVAKEYPNLDINAHEDYTGTPELAAIAVKLAYHIGVRYSELHAPETFNYIPEV